MGSGVPRGAHVKLVALMPVRNEAHQLGLTARAALMWCDHLVLLDHGSTDNSTMIIAEVICEHRDRISILVEDAGPWDEMRHRQMLLVKARDAGATHVVIVDADEILTGNLLSDIRAHVELIPREHILQLRLYNLRGSLTRFHANGIWGKDRWLSLAFRDDPKLSWSGDTFHSREPQGLALKPYKPIPHGQGGVLHLWGCEETRLRAKHRLYRVNERIRWPDKAVSVIERMYSWAEKGEPGHPMYGTPETWKYQCTPQDWWAPYAHLMQHYHAEVVPWQDAEADRLIEQYGREYFKGLSI